MSIGRMIRQPEGFSAFIPAGFPPEELLEFDDSIVLKAIKAERLIGKLDGITHTLPDVDFFLKMFVLKDAVNSTQIEGTRATMIDALELNVGVNLKDTDADDILHYTDALNYGMIRLKEFPFSLRFIKELHGVLMDNARSSHFSDPGNFRSSQNWIGGATLQAAAFVPPPVHAMHAALADLETFIHDKEIIPIIQAGLVHAQFETIHPFLDGNGRTGRLLITLFLYERALLEKPVLFLSTYFKKHQSTYYTKLEAYHTNKPNEWLHFYLDGVIETAQQSIEVSKKVTALRESDMRKIQALGKREASSGVRFLQHLYRSPITSSAIVARELDFTMPGAIKLINRFIDLDILSAPNENIKYGKTYFYDAYLRIFNE